MRIRAKTVWLVYAAVFLSLRLVAQEAPKIGCPDTVPLASPQLANPIEGWNVFVDAAPHRLSRVTFFDGPVAESASLVPDEDTRLRKDPNRQVVTSAKTRTPLLVRLLLLRNLPCPQSRPARRSEGVRRYLQPLGRDRRDA